MILSQKKINDPPRLHIIGNKKERRNNLRADFDVATSLEIVEQFDGGLRRQVFLKTQSTHKTVRGRKKANKAKTKRNDLSCLRN